MRGLREGMASRLRIEVPFQYRSLAVRYSVSSTTRGTNPIDLISRRESRLDKYHLNLAYEGTYRLEVLGARNSFRAAISVEGDFAAIIN